MKYSYYTDHQTAIEHGDLEHLDFRTDAICSLETINDFIRWTYSYLNKSDVFFGHGYDNAWDEARTLVLHVVALPYATDQDYLLSSRLTESEKTRILDLIYARVHQRTPLAYLINTSRFLNREYYVDERVIIPRSPIGELIEDGFKDVMQSSPNTILDLCTGSGVLALALALRFPEAQVDGIDISPDAIDVANINLELANDHLLSDRMAFIESDLYNSLPEGIKYDLIVSNPPYVDSNDLANMPEEFKHEPSISLGSGDDGLDITARILNESAKHLNNNGVLVVEVGNSRYALEEYLPNVPFNWLTLENGGHGVFALTKKDLEEHAQELEAFAKSKQEQN
ncbi:50S ribosomal protein L3 N(5)-glutamine methyltransferase [Psittacicella gerlachiana]|uniref:50S ribosomal protein L3 N(5)-glutamine methyltransferase n=1 Tax=Psittacicella gerlachiana TaxID=2028574 RepID=A0A3A1YLY5_9GAMM|nr:50S ribosomal protein L3 N(5)-glutamine methyltransferase [Psittacicella gerlachiana]RIY38675.1 50S ribosomal protein L3 N(5)-glutamine methyltransferase [Psittacicella gerlachiana]